MREICFVSMVGIVAILFSLASGRIVNSIVMPAYQQLVDENASLAAEFETMPPRNDLL